MSEGMDVGVEVFVCFCDGVDDESGQGLRVCLDPGVDEQGSGCEPEFQPADGIIFQFIFNDHHEVFGGLLVVDGQLLIEPGQACFSFGVGIVMDIEGGKVWLCGQGVEDMQPASDIQLVIGVVEEDLLVFKAGPNLGLPLF